MEICFDPCWPSKCVSWPQIWQWRGSMCIRHVHMQRIQEVTKHQLILNDKERIKKLWKNLYSKVLRKERCEQQLLAPQSSGLAFRRSGVQNLAILKRNEKERRKLTSGVRMIIGPGKGLQVIVIFETDLFKHKHLERDFFNILSKDSKMSLGSIFYQTEQKLLCDN